MGHQRPKPKPKPEQQQRWRQQQHPRSSPHPRPRLAYLPGTQFLLRVPAGRHDTSLSPVPLLTFSSALAPGPRPPSTLPPPPPSFQVGPTCPGPAPWPAAAAPPAGPAPHASCCPPCRQAQGNIRHHARCRYPLCTPKRVLLPALSAGAVHYMYQASFRTLYNRLQAPATSHGVPARSYACRMKDDGAALPYARTQKNCTRTARPRRPGHPPQRQSLLLAEGPEPRLVPVVVHPQPPRRAQAGGRRRRPGAGPWPCPVGCAGGGGQHQAGVGTTLEGSACALGGLRCREGGERRGAVGGAKRCGVVAGKHCRAYCGLGLRHL